MGCKCFAMLTAYFICPAKTTTYERTDYLWLRKADLLNGH